MGQPPARRSTTDDVEPTTRVAPSAARPWWRAGVLLVVVAMVSGSLAVAAPAGAAVAGDPSGFAAAAVDEGPGGPILVVSSAAHPFSEYYVEILRNEGLNAFDGVDIATVTPATLAAHDVVVLGEIPINASQAAMLAAWVADGGNLIAMRPDPDLASLVGVTDTGTDLSDKYLQIDTASGTPGAGLVGQTIQFHGTADRYDLDAGTGALATLWSTASTATTNPAVTLRSVGSNGGEVAAFAYDLARSVVYTRQGNPEWAEEERDGEQPPIIRADDLFFPDWIDFDKVQIPQADEQQRLLANLIEHTNRDVMPLPRFSYFPRGERAVVVMTGDDHASSDGTAGQFDWANSVSPPGCVVADWQCVRGTSYVYPSTPLGDAAAAGYEAQGFEVALHPTTNCADWNPTSLAEFFDDQLSAFASAYPSVAPPATNRTHCITWSDWATHPKTELAEGIRLDTNYYYWPASWVNNRPGYFTGSGLPMRFADLDGSVIDVYQAATQMTDESGIGYAHHITTLLDNALGAPGYYGAITANMHTDTADHPGQKTIVNAALARGVPVVSARQMLTWLDGRNGSSFEDLAWDGNDLTFSIAAAPGANGLQALLPTAGPEGTLESLTLGGNPVAYQTQTIKGIEYAAFTAGAGTYSATFDVDVAAPAITDVQAVPGAPDEATVTWTTDEPATSRVDFGTSAGALSSSEEDLSLTTAHELHLTDLDADTTYFFRVSSTDGFGNTAVEPAPPATDNFTTSNGVATDTTVADFGAGVTGASTYVSDTDGGEVILAPAVGTEFDGPGIPAGWTTGSWTGGATTVDGEATVDGSWIRANGLVGAGRAVEFSATFSGDAFQNAGFGVTLDSGSESWAMFGTNATADVLQARVNSGGGSVDVPLGAQYLDSEHTYRIEWDATEVRFYIDGDPDPVHTAETTVGGTMRPIASDFGTGGGALSIDWMRMTPYATPGTFTSRVHDAGNPAEWGALSYATNVPSGTTLALSVRTGPTPVPGGGWSAFAPVTSGADVPTDGRYLQYRAVATSATGAATPTLSSVTLPFTAAPDVTDPTITARTPAPGATGVAIGTNVTVTFDEAVVPPTDWASAVTLRAEGSGTDVPAVVTANGAVVTLNPAGDLTPGTEYTVTVDGSVADTSGNPLGADDTWSFTTSAPPSFVVDDTVAEFGAGVSGGSIYVSNADGGEVILAPTVGTEFDGPGIPAGWTTGSWTGGATTVDGEATVDGSWIRANGLVGAGRAVEFSATFNGDTFQNAGFGVTLDEGESWAMFGTNATPGVLQARTRNGGGAILDQSLGTQYIGSEHVFRIEWDTAVRFYIDGALVHTAATVGGTMRPIASDFGTGGGALSIDWLRMSPYASSGTFTSRVLDAGALADWQAAEVTDSTPAGTTVGYEVRIGDTTNPNDGTWSAFTPMVDGGDIAGMSRYAQYRATLTTTDPDTTPALERVALGYVAAPAGPTIVGGIGTVVEGDTGTVQLQVPVSLSAPSGATVRANWTTVPTTGLVAGADYDTATGTVVFTPGDTQELITITVHGDNLDEPGVLFGSEWLFLVMSAPVNGAFGPGLFGAVAHGFIADDDPTPVIQGGIGTVIEGDTGTVELHIPVRLSAPSEQTVTMNYTTIATTGLVPGEDYLTETGTITFAPNDTEEFVTITVLGDNLDEPGVLFGAEWLFLGLSTPTHAVFGPGLFGAVAHGFIADDD